MHAATKSHIGLAPLVGSIGGSPTLHRETGHFAHHAYGTQERHIYAQIAAFQFRVVVMGDAEGVRTERAYLAKASSRLMRCRALG